MKTIKVLLGWVICLQVNISVTYSQYHNNEVPGSTGIHQSSGHSLSEPLMDTTKNLKSFILLPDIQCSYFWWKSEKITEADYFWVSVKVDNAGAQSAGPSHIEAYLSTDNDWDLTDDYFIGKQSVDSLPSGDYDSIQWNFKFPDIGSGLYPVWIVTITDCDHEVRESNENNTWKCISSFKVIDPPDLSVNTSIVDIYEIGDTYYSEGFDYVNNKQKSHLQASSSNEYLMGLIIPEDIERYGKTHTTQLRYNTNEFPDSVDWSSFDSPVKNQALHMCQSCWAFAATALIENLSNHNDLSEQAIISCAGNSNCGGGWTGEALKYIAEIGIPNEECYRYIGQNGNCSDKCEDPNYLVKLIEYDYFPKWQETTDKTVDDLKALLQNGPVIVSMTVPNDNTFKGIPGYTGGIYNYSGGIIDNKNMHAVLVVGYNDNGQYFRVKNSWGPVWGEKGYFRIAYDDVTDDVHFGGNACTGWGVYTKSKGDEFILSNIGSSNLEIKNICSDKTWLHFNPASSQIQYILPGNSVTIDCVVDWKNVSRSSDTAIVTINSNDPYESRFELKVTAIRYNFNQIPDTGGLNGPTEVKVDRMEFNNDIIIYPNPVSDYIFIRFKSDIIHRYKITLIDNYGRIVYLEVFENIYYGTENKIDLSGLANGIYFLRVDYQNGMKTRKIIKD